MHFSSFSKKVLVGTITLLFLGVLFLIYLFISSKPSEKHLNFIPATAQSVLIIDPFEIGEELKTQIQKNPSLILKFDLTQLFSKNVSIGINPLAKIGIFQDYLEKKFIIGATVSLKDSEDFISYIFKNDIQPTRTNEFDVFIENNIATALLQDAGIVLYSQSPFLNKDLILDYIEKLVQDQKQDSTFFLNTNSQFTLWNKKINHPLANYFSLNSQTTNVNLSENGLDIKSTIELNDSSIFSLTNSTSICLGKSELGKLSFSVSESKASGFLSYLPFKLDSIQKYLGQKMWISAIGFRKKNVIYKDSTVLNENFSIPEFAIGIELTSAIEVKDLMPSNFTFNKTNDCYEITSKDFKNEIFYVYVHQNQLIITSLPVNIDELSLDFHTLSLRINLEKTIDSYLVRKIYQQLLLSSIKNFNPKNFEFYCEKVTNSELFINGSLHFNNENEHFLETFLNSLPLLTDQFSTEQ